MPGIIGSRAGKAMISAGVFESFAKSIPMQPTKKLAKKVAMAKFGTLTNSLKVKRKPCPMEAKNADKNSTLKGGLQEYAKPKPATAAKHISAKIG